MSVHVMSWVLRNSEERLGRRLVLLVLADHASEDGTGAWPSVATIAREARMSESQSRECLRRLEDSGAIRKTGEKSSSGTYIYDVLMEGAPESGGGTESTAKGHRKADSEAPEIGAEPSLEPSEGQPSTPLQAAPARAQRDSRLPVPVPYDPLKGVKVEGRNIPFDALAEETRADVDAEGSRIAKALQRIRQLAARDLGLALSDDLRELSPAACETMIATEIRNRARAYRAKWPDIDLTPSALAHNWTRVTVQIGPNLDSALEAAQRGLDAGRES